MKFAGAWNGFWFLPRRAEDLAINRILFGLGLLALSSSRPIHEWADVPASFQQPAHFFAMFDVPIASSAALQLIQQLWQLSIVTLTIGLWTRASAAFACVGSLYLFGLDAPELLGRSYTPAVFVTAILACARCGDALSVDAWWRLRRGRPARSEPAEEYGWPARLVCAFLAYTFFAAGVSKIRITGWPEWMLSDMPYRTLLLGNYWYASRGQAPFEVGPALLRSSESFGLLVGVVTQLAELLYPLALFARWARAIFVPLMLVVLVGIAVALGPFFGLTMLAHVFWVPWTTILWRRSSVVSGRVAALKLSR